MVQFLNITYKCELVNFILRGKYSGFQLFLLKYNKTWQTVSEICIEENYKSLLISNEEIKKVFIFRSPGQRSCELSHNFASVLHKLLHFHLPLKSPGQMEPNLTESIYGRSFTKCPRFVQICHGHVYIQPWHADFDIKIWYHVFMYLLFYSKENIK